MATTPLWSEVEAQPWFSTLTPEQKSQSLKSWTTDALNEVKTPEERLVVEAASDARSKFFAGTPMPENMGEYVKTYAQQKAQQEIDAKAKEKENRPFFGFGDTLNALGTIASNLPTNVKAAAYQLKEGLAMPSERSQGYLDAMAEKRAADEAVQADQAQREAQGLATSVGSAGREFSNSSGFSGVAMGAALAGGAAGSATGSAIGTAVGAGATLPAGGVGAAPGAGAGSLIGATVGAIGGLASSGTAAYRMAGATFLDDAFDMANKQSVEEKGRPLNKEEEKSLYDKILPIAQNTALWEAGPEAIGNVFTMGVGKLIFKGPAKEIATTFAKKALRVAGLASADVGVELAGETATQVGGQGWDQAKLEAILAGKNPDEVANPYAGVAGIAKGFEEIAPATLFGSALMGGGAGLVGLAKDQYIKAQAAKAQQIADTAAALAATNSTQTLNALVETGYQAAATAGLLVPENTQERLAARTAGLEAAATAGLVAPEGTEGRLAARTAGLVAPEGTEGRLAARTAGLAAPEGTEGRLAARTAGLVAPEGTEGRLAARTAGLEVPEDVQGRLAARTAGLTAPEGVEERLAARNAGLVAPEGVEGRLAARTAGLVAPVRPTPQEEAPIVEEVAPAPVKETAPAKPAAAKPIVTPVAAKKEPVVVEDVAVPEVVTDPARRQEITNSLQEGLLILKTKKNNAGKRLSAPELAAVQRSVDSDKAKLGIAVKEAPAQKPKSYRRTSRFDNNPNTGKPDILNFVAAFGMVVPSAKLKAAEKKAGKSVGGERDPLQDVDLDEGEKRKLWTVSDTTIPFDAQTIDKVAQAAFDDNLISAPTADALIEKMVEASKERKSERIEDQQQAIFDDREAQTKAFDEAVTTPAKDKERIASSEVVIGNKYSILGEEFTVKKILFDEADGTPIGLVLTSPTFGAQKASLEEPFYVAKKQAGLESLLEGTESTRPKNKGETAKPQAADPLAELGAATRAGKAEQDQGKMELPPAAEAKPTEAKPTKPARKKIAAEKLAALDSEAEALLKELRALGGRMNMGIDPAYFAIVARLGKVVVAKGAVNFQEFASDIKDMAPDLWTQLKQYLSSVWNFLANADRSLPEVTRSEVDQVLADLDAVVAEEPVVEEETSIVEEEETPVVEVKPIGRNGTEDQLQSADDHAKDLGGTVVYQEGDIALVRGYAILDGQPVYSAVNKDSRTRFDIASYTGSLVSPEQKAELIRIKDQLEEADQKAFNKNPFVIFNNGLAFSKSISPAIAGVIRGWKSLLGLKGNLYVTTYEDVVADKDMFNGPQRAIGSAGLNSSNTDGSIRRMPNGDHYIMFRVIPGKTKMLETLAHELGHLHEREAFKNADEETKQALRDEHSKWLKTTTGKTAQEFINSLRANRTALANVKRTEGMSEEELTSYWKSFGEWYADQVSRWAVSSAKPLSVVDQFFSRIAKVLRSFYAKISNQGYLPNESFVTYLERTLVEPERIVAEEETPVVVEEVPPVTEETAVVVEEEEEITTEKFPENSTRITSLTKKENVVTFGKSRKKTIGAIFREGKAEYLFKTLFGPEVMKDATAERKAEVERHRASISQTEEYKAYQKEQSMTESELATSRKPFVESNKLSDSLNNLQALGYDAKLLPDGSIAIAATGPAVANKEAIASSGFSYDNKKGWVSKTYERVVDLANLAVSQEAGQPMGSEAVADAKIAKIRMEQRDKLAEQENQSQPPRGKMARSYMTNAVVKFYERAMNKALAQEEVKGGKVDIPSTALTEQQWDSMLISKAQAEKKPMYLLSSSAGTGKTFVMGAALANIRSRIPEGRIVFVTRSKKLIRQAKRDFANFPEVGNVEFFTYAEIDNKQKKAEFEPSASDVMIFDEAHEIRFGLSGTSERAKKAAGWMEKAKFTLLTSATPYESIEQMEYLKATGVFDSLKDVKGLFDDGWFNFATIAGAKVLQREGKPSSIDFDKMTEAETLSGRAYAREFLVKNGMYSKRSALIAEGFSDSTFTEVTGSKEWETLANQIEAAFDLVENPSPNDKGFYTNILKRVLEASKVEAAIDLARKEVAEGRQVVLFIETKSETNRDLEDIVEKWDEAQAEFKAAKAIDPSATFVAPEGVPNLPGVIGMFRNMIAAGVTEINFKSAKESYTEAFGDQVAFYTGDQTELEAEDALSRWMNPDSPNSVPILVATMARGGTGLSMHDVSEGGKYPRTQIVLNLPWRASEVEQVAGRTVRYGMTSPSRSYWLYANNIINEKSLVDRVAARLLSMNYLVNGFVSDTAKTMGSLNWTANPIDGTFKELFVETDTDIGGAMAEDFAEDVRTSLSEQVPSGKVVGGITEQNAKNGLDLIAKLIPMARRMVRLATSAELLADETLTPDERASVRSGTQGYYSRGKVVLVIDQVKQTIFHKNADVAAAATILHEMFHHGTSVIRDSKDGKLLYGSWLKLVSEYVTEAQIERLVNVQGYSAYANWGTDMEVKEKAMEEIFVRQLEGLFVRKGSLSFVEKNKLQKFLSWLKEFVNSALGLPQGTQIPDSHLEEMGWRFVAAIESAQFVERTQDVRESAADLGSLPPQSQTSLLSPYTKEEKEALTAYLNSRPDLGLKFGQILGLEDGSIADVQSIAASESLAYEYLQLDADKGRPVVGRDDVDRLLGIAAQLTAKKSTFGINYQQGKPDAATGVLQMVLTQAGLEMARNGDSRLIEMLRQNWNGIVMGAFLTHSSAGRLLQSRKAYKNEILDTMYELEQAAKASATKYLQDQGVEEAENVLRSVEELIQNAQLDAQALEALKKTVSGIKVGAQDGLSERITEALKFTGGEIKRQFTSLTQLVLQVGAKEKLAQDMRDKKAASSASQSFADDIGIGEPLPVYESLEELERSIEEDRKAIAKLVKSLGKALGTKPPAPPVSVPTPNIPTADEGVVEELEDVEDVKEEENKNEATKAAEAILSNLKAFLERKFSKEAKAPSIYAIIKKAVDANIANTPKYTVFKYFADDLEKELEPFDIEDSVREELIATAWSTSSRYAEKEAEKITDRFLSKKEVQDNLKPDNVVKLRALVKEFLRNKKKLEEQDFVDTMAPLVAALNVPAEIAEELAMATYGEHLVRKEAALQRMLERTKASLLAGSRKTLVSQIKAADQADINDATWQDAALRKVLTLSGILPSELDRAMGVFTEADKATIFGTTLEKMNKAAAENLNKSVQRLTKNYEEYLKRPTNTPKPTPSETLRKLVRNLVALDIGRPLFVTQAAAFGATEAQANRLYDLARTERSLREGEGTTTTKMDVLIKYITSDASLQNDPALRLEAIKAWLRNNGYTSQAADNAAAAIDAAFEEQVIAAQMKAMEKFEIKISSRKQAQLKQKAENANVNVAEKQVKKLQELIRIGLGKDKLDPTKSFARAAGYENLQPSDYKALGELDIKITQAKADQRIHDYAIGVKELYELLARRKLEMGFLARLAISYNNSALSGLGTLAINIIAPMGAMMTRVGLDMGTAIARGDIQAVKDIFKVLQDTVSIIKNEVKFSITGGANTNDWSRVIMNATSLQQPLVKAMQKINNPSTPALEKLKARMVVVQSWTDVTRRVLMATDHVWFSMLDNYFRKTQALDVMRRAGVQDQAKIDQVKALLFAGTNIYGPRLANELTVLQRYEAAIEQLRGLPDAKQRILDLVTAPLDAEMKIEARKFEEDIRGDIRRASQGSVLTQAKSVKQALGAVRLQRTLSNIRIRDNVARDINLAIKGILPDIQFPDFVEKETAYEMGVHRGEEAPSLDVVNAIVNVIQGAGNKVIQKHPILGRMLLGYFGIPSNLLNRAMWFTPYGLIRYAIAAKTRKDVRVGPNPFYQQSMATNEQIRQRLVEATVGTTAVAILMALKALSDDDDDSPFNVTLMGPTNKTELDAWKKAGHRQGSIEVRVGDKIVALNAMRGPLEPLKIALLMVGAMDDMRLNRKENDGEFAQYFSEYLTAMLSGWSKQASFFGAKSTIGATLAVNPDASVVSTALYKLNPIIPFSGLIASAEKLMTGGDRFRGREGSIYLNLPIARSLLTQKAVNALGDPQGLNPSSAWTETNERAWWAGFPLMVSGTPTGNDKKVYEFILDRGIAPGLPQRTALENKNGVMSDSNWQDYVAVRGTYIKRAMIRDLARLRKMDDDSAAKALGQISTDATAAAKKQLRYK